MSQTACNLLDFDRQALTEWLAPHQFSKPQVARLFQAIHQHQYENPQSLHFINRKLREFLIVHAYIGQLAVKKEQLATDGVIKWLFELADGNAIETVYIPEKKRATLCISSQVGCSLNCSFCATARQGFNRNLTTAEIIGQIYTASERIKKFNSHSLPPITNVVFMGMGEPLLNFESVISAANVLLDDWAYGLAHRKVTISTSGVVPAMLQLKQRSPVALAVSLHAPNDELRNLLVPLNKRYPLKDLISVCRHYYTAGKREVTFEYVMLDGINDQNLHVEQLFDLLKDVPAKINLIPFNPFPQAEFKTSPTKRILEFQKQLLAGGIVTTVRRPRGEKIAAACGQLAGEVSSKADRQRHITKTLGKINIIHQSVNY